MSTELPHPLVQLTASEQNLEEVSIANASSTGRYESWSEKCHTCAYCGKGFARLSYLSRHMTAHTSTYSCSVCCKQFARPASLKSHNCPGDISSNSDYVLSHQEEHSTSRKRKCASTKLYQTNHPCTECACVFRRRETLLKHLVKEHPHVAESRLVSAYPCLICSRVFVSMLSLSNHQRLHLCGDQTLFVCKICSLCCTSQSDLSSHACNKLETFSSEDVPPTNGMTVDISELSEAHDSSSADKEHMTLYNDFHKNQTKKMCSLCGKTVTSISNLYRHMKTHGEKTEMCSVCGKKFHLRASLEEHVQNVHLPPGSHAVECKDCGKRMRSRNSLYAHRARFHPSPQQLLMIHRCPTCGRSFHLRGNLNKHMRTHTEDLNYVCHHCHRAFRSPAQFRKHVVWHQSGAAHVCQICSQKFIMQWELRQHIRTRHVASVVTYRCKYCGVCCHLQQTMRRHLMRKHAEISEWQMEGSQSFIGSLIIKPVTKVNAAVSSFPSATVATLDPSTTVSTVITVDENLHHFSFSSELPAPEDSLKLHFENDVNESQILADVVMDGLDIAGNFLLSGENELHVPHEFADEPENSYHIFSPELDAGADHLL